MEPELYEPIRMLLDQMGLRTPADAVREFDLEPQVAELRAAGVPEELAVRVVLVSYGKAVKQTGSIVLRGFNHLFGRKG